MFEVNKLRLFGILFSQFAYSFLFYHMVCLENDAQKTENMDEICIYEIR